MSEKLLTRKELLRTGLKKIGGFIDMLKEGDGSVQEPSSGDETVYLKPDTENGIAVIDKKNCLSWERGTVCALCKYRCPQDAIALEDGRLPVIDHSKCNGCGLCSDICPTSPAAVEIAGSVKKNA